VTIRIGRWEIERSYGAIYIQHCPKPDCTACDGTGRIEHGPGIGPDGEEPDIETCPCWNPGRYLRIPLGPRERYPF
jgi:hypothetical protein